MIQLKELNIPIFKKMKKFPLQKVKYSSKRATDHEASFEFLEKIMFQKDKAWSHEKEWRVVLMLKHIEQLGKDDQNNPLYCQIVPIQSIEKIVLGTRSNEQLANHVLKWRDEHAQNVQIQKAVPCNQKYELLYRDI